MDTFTERAAGIRLLLFDVDGVLTDGRVYVDLPAALRALRPEGSADLEWLDEPNPPLTTLHQLEHLRRRAA